MTGTGRAMTSTPLREQMPPTTFPVIVWGTMSPYLSHTHFTQAKQYETRSSAVAGVADSTAYDTVQSVVWNRRGQHDYLGYIFTVSNFYDGQLFSLLLIHPTTKVFKDVNRKFTSRNTTVQLSTPYIDLQRHIAQGFRQTDGIYMMPNCQ